MKMIAALSSLVFACAVTAGASAVAPPPEDSGPADEAEVIELYNVIDDRADQIAAALDEDQETCPYEFRTPQVVLPVTQSDSLAGYAFVTPRFCLTRNANQFEFVNRMHFLVDEIVRAGHRTPIKIDADQARDDAETEEALLTVAASILGEGRIDRVDLLGSDIRYLR